MDDLKHTQGKDLVAETRYKSVEIHSPGSEITQVPKRISVLVFKVRDPQTENDKGRQVFGEDRESFKGHP